MAQDDLNPKSLAAKLRAEMRADLEASLTLRPRVPAPVPAAAATTVSPTAAPGRIPGVDGRPELLLPATPVPSLALPPTLKAGLTVSYQVGDSTAVRGDRIGGVGFTNANINCTRDKLVCIDLRRYFTLDPSVPRAQTIGAAAVVGNEVSAGIYWIHPALLAQLIGDGAPKQDEGVKVERGPFDADGVHFNAVWIDQQTKRTANTVVYDLETGVLLSQASKTDDGDSRAFQTYRSQRALQIPWADRPVPEWVGKTRRLTYQGGNTINVAGFNVQQAVTLTADLRPLGPGVLLASFTAVTDSGAGLPGERNTWDMVCAPAMLYPLWIAPEALRELKPNQPIDDDPVTGFRMMFVGVEGEYAAIAEEGPLERTTFFFDLKNGMFSGLRGQRPFGAGGGQMNVETWLRSAE